MVQLLDDGGVSFFHNLKMVVKYLCIFLKMTKMPYFSKTQQEHMQTHKTPNSTRWGRHSVAVEKEAEPATHQRKQFQKVITFFLPPEAKIHRPPSARTRKQCCTYTALQDIQKGECTTHHSLCSMRLMSSSRATSQGVLPLLAAFFLSAPLANSTSTTSRCP